MARYWCERCGAASNTLDQPHVCKDVGARLRRRTAQMDAVRRLLIEDRFLLATGEYDETAERIVTVLSRLGVTED